MLRARPGRIRTLGHQHVVVVTDCHLADGETGTLVISGLRDILGSRFKAVLMTGDTSPAVSGLKRDLLF